MSLITEQHRDILRNNKPRVWATIVPTRTTKPVVVLHNTLAHAKTAVRNVKVTSSPRPGYDKDRGGYPVGESEVYELIDGVWTLQWRIEEGTYPDELPWCVE